MARRPQLSEEEQAALVARRARSERRFGTICSVVGGVLLGIILVTLIGGGLLISAADAARDAGQSSEALEALRPGLGLAVLLVPAILVLFALAGLMLGEQMRRGSLALSLRDADEVRAGGSIVSEFGALGYGWHALWVVLGLVVMGALVLLPALSWFTGAWPHADPDGGDFAQFWVIYGALGFGVAVAGLVSLVKKVCWAAAVRRRPELREGGESSPFWRWLTFRWRFDLWIAGIGGLAIAFSATLAPSAAEPDGGGAVVAMTAMIVGGIVFVVLGAVLASQFWRSGERIGRAESVI